LNITGVLVAGVLGIASEIDCRNQAPAADTLDHHQISILIIGSDCQTMALTGMNQVVS
jgi:hypothetical protein